MAIPLPASREASPVYPKSAEGPHTITRLLDTWSRGKTQALRDLMPEVVGELRKLARSQLARERPDHTLQPTALIHEVYLRLVRQRKTSWSNRGPFFAFAATLMRRILVSHARKHRAAKRGGEATCMTLEDELWQPQDPGSQAQGLDVLALNQALKKLTRKSQRQAQVVELRFFAGFTVEETAHALGVSPATVKLDWSIARAWLFRELSQQGTEGETSAESAS